MKARIKFAKKGAMKFIGHLDIMRYFQKAIRRAGIPIAYSEGYSPHMIMSFAQPLGVGVTSDSEYFDIELTREITSAEAVKCLNAVMAEGMEIISYRRIPDDKANRAMSLVAAADYTVTFRENHEPLGNWQERIADFYAQNNIIVWKKTKKSEREVDIKPLIQELYVIEQKKVFMRVIAGSAENLKPDLVMSAFVSFLGGELAPFSLMIHRNELYANEMISLEALGEEI